MITRYYAFEYQSFRVIIDDSSPVMYVEGNNILVNINIA